MKVPSALCLALVMQAGITQAQSDAAPEAIYLKKNTNVEIDVSGGRLLINEHYFSEKAFYRNFEKHSRESVFYSDFDPVTSMEATTLIPDGSGYKKMKVSTIETKDIVQPGIFYGGYKRRDFVFPMLKYGAIGRLEYSKQIPDVHLLSPFYFTDEIDVENAAFSVTFPKSVSVKYKLFGSQTEKIKFSQKDEGSKVQFTWTLTDVPAYREENSSPAMPYAAPHIVVYIDSYESKGGRQRVLSDVSDLYKWYHELVNKIPADDNSQLAASVKEIVKHCTTEQDKVRAIFQWVQQNIKYVAFENGMAGFVPRSAADVFNKRYGDCKDMANLLKDMLKLSGIEAHHTWIGTRSKPYSYQDVPTAIADNHMICSVKLDGQYVFLDATNSFLTFGKPSSMIQGKEALVGIGDRYEVVKVPVVDAAENQRVDSIVVRVNNNVLEGEFKGFLTGYRKDDIEISHLKSQINNDREYIRDFFTIGGNNISIENLKLMGLGNQNAPARVDFTFSLPGYYKSIGDKIYVNLNLNKTLPGEKIDQVVRQQALECEYWYEDRSVTTFEIPDSYQASFIPQNTQKSWPLFGINVSYKITGNTVVVEKVVHSNFLYLSKDGFGSWNEFLQTLNAVNQQSITLLKK